MTRYLACLVLLVPLCTIPGTPLQATGLLAEHPATRKVVKKVLPAYPDLARRLNMKGMVKLQLLVDPEGRVKTTKVMGGNPAFVEAALQVINKWKFEPAGEQTTETVQILFDPSDQDP